MLISCMNVDVLSYVRQNYHKCEKSEIKIAKYVIALNSLSHRKMEKFFTSICLKQKIRGCFYRPHEHWSKLLRAVRLAKTFESSLSTAYSFYFNRRFAWMTQT